MNDFTKFTKEYVEEMNTHLPTVIDFICKDILNSDYQCGSIKNICESTKEMIYYNLEGGKKLRACLFLATYNCLHHCPGRRIYTSICDKHVRFNDAVYMLAWAIEMMQASFLISDDIMDGSKLRRGKPCWYVKVAERNRISESEGDITAGISAVNDSYLLGFGIDRIVANFFADALFKKIIMEFNDVYLKSTYGQKLDTDRNSVDCSYQFLKNVESIKSSEEYSSILDKMETRYMCTIKYKTFFYTFRLPIALAYILSKASSYENAPSFVTVNLPAYEVLTSLAYQMSVMFQIRDDMIDWCSELSNSQKSRHSDIMEGKLTWPFITCLKEIHKMNDGKSSSLDLIKANYGGTFVQSNIISSLYEKMKIYDIYKAKMSALRTDFMNDLNTLNHESMKNTLIMFMENFCLAS